MADYAMKSIVVKEKNNEGKDVMWALVCYDHVELKHIEKEFITQLKTYKSKAQKK
jgi:hypothetical protein